MNEAISLSDYKSRRMFVFFLEVLNNADKAKQDKCGEVTWGMSWQEVVRSDKTNQDQLGRRGCTES